MSAPEWPSESRRLELALRMLATTEAKVHVVAAKFGLDKADLWAWMNTHNGGRRSFSPALLERVLTAEARARVTAPAPKETKAASPAKPAPAVKSLPANTPLASSAAPAAPEDDGSSPWTKRPEGPRRGTMARHRATLEAIAAGKVNGPLTDKTLRGFVTHWLATVAPAPARVTRFLAWCDARPVKAPKFAPFELPLSSTAKAARSEAKRHLAERSPPSATRRPLWSEGFPALAAFIESLGSGPLLKLEIEVRLVPVGRIQR